MFDILLRIRVLEYWWLKQWRISQINLHTYMRKHAISIPDLYYLLNCGLVVNWVLHWAYWHFLLFFNQLKSHIKPSLTKVGLTLQAPPPQIHMRTIALIIQKISTKILHGNIKSLLTKLDHFFIHPQLYQLIT